MDRIFYDPQLVIPETFEECLTYEMQVLYLKKYIDEIAGGSGDNPEIMRRLEEVERRLSELTASFNNLDETTTQRLSSMDSEIASINDAVVTLGSSVSSQVQIINNELSSINEQLNDITEELDSKQDELTFDSTPTSGSSNPVTSDGIYTAIQAGGSGPLDDNVTENSQNAVKSSGIYAALELKQDELTAGPNMSLENNTVTALTGRVPLDLTDPEKQIDYVVDEKTVQAYNYDELPDGAYDVIVGNYIYKEVPNKTKTGLLVSSGSVLIKSSTTLVITTDAGQFYISATDPDWESQYCPTFNEITSPVIAESGGSGNAISLDDGVYVRTNSINYRDTSVTPAVTYPFSGLFEVIDGKHYLYQYGLVFSDLRSVSNRVQASTVEPIYEGSGGTQTVDSTVTAQSSNPVASSGIYQSCIRPFNKFGRASTADDVEYGTRITPCTIYAYREGETITSDTPKAEGVYNGYTGEITATGIMSYFSYEQLIGPDGYLIVFGTDSVSQVTAKYFTPSIAVASAFASNDSNASSFVKRNNMRVVGEPRLFTTESGGVDGWGILLVVGNTDTATGSNPDVADSIYCYFNIK